LPRVKVGIGITTYAEVAAPEVGAAVFDAYDAVSSRITPNQILAGIFREKHTVSNRSDFAAHWVSTSEMTTWADKKMTERLSHQEIVSGAEWRRTGALPGTGQVQLRSPMAANDSNSLLIQHTFDRRIDWLALFRRLVDLLSPSHAMLHLFTEAEMAPYLVDDRSRRFDQPFAGEYHFTGHRYPNGLRLRPSQWETAERRTYRYLPELTWGVVLGPEFTGQYNAEIIRRFGYEVTIGEHGAWFTMTPKLDDMETDPASFEAARRRLRSAFPEWAFERP
jgi:hypothetical protein